MYPKTHLLAAFILLAAPLPAAQQDFSKVEIKTIPVSKHIHMLEGAGGNIGVSIGTDGILIVDNQFAPLADKISAALQQLSPGRLRFVLNTHHHGDHTGGNAAFGAKDATIIAQANVRQRLRTDTRTKPEALPVITFDQSASVHFNGEEIRLLHVGPGHTNGDSIIHFTGANVIHMGDQFINGGFPFIDFSSGGNVDGYVATIEAVLRKAPADAKVIPGHGKLATMDDMKAYLGMLHETIAHVRRGMQEGRTLEQLRAAGLPEKWKSYGTGFINANRWIEAIYNQAQQAPKP
jgi:glyoxylase-like metal-dependent hydrolase (beta-lactamase superfamily II)